MTTMLLVGNEPDNTSVLRMCLEDEGFKVDSFNNETLRVPPPGLLDGVNCFIPKPVDIDELVKKVNLRLSSCRT